MRRRPERFGAALVLAILTAGALTGCVPQSRDSLDRYVDALDAVPGVFVDYYGVSTPLPFAVQGTVDVSFDADAATLAELQRVACETEVNASVHLSIAVRAGDSTVRLDGVAACDDLLVDVVGLATAVASFGIEMSVDDVVGARVGVDGADDLVESLAVLDASTDFLPAGPSSLAAEGIRLVTDDPAVAAAYLDDFTQLAAAFGIAEIDLEHPSLVVQVTTASEAQAVEDFLLARDGARYGGLTIVVTDAAAGAVPAGTDAAVIELRDRIVAELGLSVNIGGNAVYVQARDGREVVQISTAIATLNPEAVAVGIGILEDEAADVPAFRQRRAPELTTARNPYPAWVAQYDRLVDTGLVQTVEVGPGTLEAWLRDADYDDRDAFATVRAVLDDLADEDDLTRWGLNNRDLTAG